ncbi:Dus3p [Malassezia vespertilionis]|uniref:tRNA-dihydrouridine(47) synthase [NAD(P)(+)] n=1 Tax=Malassezia vespertilionis TaxID=2020962 RepID=A0A2N1J8J6_9BASI|nr:Dus3p [Malassezia vespertilionis]
MAATYVLNSWPSRSVRIKDGAPSILPEVSTSEPSSDARPQKRARGQNKGRTFAKTGDQVSLCSQIAQGGECAFGEQCRLGHDLCAYLEHKPRDLFRYASPAHDADRDAWLEQQFLHAAALDAGDLPAPGPCDDVVQQSLDYTTSCPYYETRVRVSGSRAAAGDAAQGTFQTGLTLHTDLERVAAWEAQHPSARANNGSDEINWVSGAQMRALRLHKYKYERAPAIVAKLQDEARSANGEAGKGALVVDYAYEAALAQERARAPSGADATEEALEEHANALRNVRPSDDAADLARVRAAEKRRLQWHGELYLAPLTTTGNLPFRRICTTFGSDIHCGEMGMAESFTNGHASEWSLTRRWDGERIFGTQVCGAKPEYLVPAAEVLAREIGSGLDFVDVNCGCPIDLVYNKGGGSALLDHANKLGRIVRGMNAALGEIPLTIKLRTGTSAKQTTHKIFARAQTEWGVQGVTLHGRTRKQRYKNDADWSYIGTCADALRESVRAWNEEAVHADMPEMQPVPIYGNGDVYSWQDYYRHMEETRVDGEMIARGALIKPWIFTEIKERRDWDISSRERLDMVRQFAEYGLTHWGADTQGVNTTRRFLCEMLSFTHRYIPIGILEHVPVRMNDRPKPFQGRDPLESLLSSPSAQDWVRVSELFLGKAPQHWHFMPKHKSNSFGDAALEG